MARKKTRRVWTDEMKEELIRNVPKVGRVAFLRSRGVNSTGWFDRMRANYLKTHHKFAASLQVPAQEPMLERLPAAVPVVPLDFATADNPTKYEMLKEYDALPTTEEKAKWRGAHGMPSQPLLTYHRSRMCKKEKVKPASSKVPPDVLAERSALVAEYVALTGPGAKSEWLKTHGMNHQDIHAWKLQVAKANQDQNGNLPAVRTKKPATQDKIPVYPAHVPTLEDGVRYLEIKRDMFTEIITDLQRVLRGAR